MGEAGSSGERVKSSALSASCLQKRNKSGLGGRMPGSLGWGWAARDVGDGCVCPGGENNTLDFRRKDRECEDENFSPFLALGTNHSIKITWDWMSGPCQDRSGPAPPTPSWPQAHISHAAPPTFLELSFSSYPRGEDALSFTGPCPHALPKRAPFAPVSPCP